MKRTSLALVLALSLVTSFATTASARQLFAPVYNADGLAVLSSDPASGALAHVSGSPFTIGAGGVTSWAMTPDGNLGVAGFLFGGFRPFSIAPSGLVTPTQGQVVWPAGVGSNSVAVAPNGKTAYAANRVYPASPSAQGIRAYALSGAGALTEVAGSPYVPGEEFADVAVTPDGSKIFGTTAASVYHGVVGADGTLGTLTAQSFPGTYFLATSPDSRFVFASGNFGGNSFMRVLAVAADGSLSAVGAPITIGTGTPRPPAVSPDGAFVYASDANVDKIVTVRIAPDGTPTVVGSPTDFEDPYQTAISPDGKFLYVSNTGGAYSLNVAPIGADGRPGAFTKSVPYDTTVPVRLVFRPGQGTVASYRTELQRPPLAMTFDAAATTAVAGSVGRYTWDFGDGSTSATAMSTITHQFAKAGVYDVRLTASDDSGCAAAFVYSGQSTVCNGSAASVKTIKVDTPPWITSLKASHKTLKSKSKIKFTLTESASVSFYVQKPLKGRTVGTSCKKQTKRNKTAKKCTRWVRASKTFRKSGKVGRTNSFKFAGKIGKKQLANGKYRFYAVATDSAKGKGPAVTANFRVKTK